MMTPVDGEGRCPLCGLLDAAPIVRVTVDQLVRIYGTELAPLIRDELSRFHSLSLFRCVSCDLQFFEPAAPGSPRLYMALAHSDDYYQTVKPEFGFAKSRIIETDKVLEVGCGSGSFGASIRASRYVGLESSPVAIAAARTRGLAVHQESIEAHAAREPGSYDVVCAFQVLEHVPNVREFLSSCLRALRPGGRLVISVPSADSFAAYLPNFALDLPPHHLTRWTDKCLQEVPRLFGVDLLELWSEPLQPIHRRLRARAEAYRRLYWVLGTKPPVIGSGWSFQLMRALAIGITPLLYTLASRASAARGISVTAVFQSHA